jgi:lipopolysaccharide transport system ATP-binding protein
MSEVIKVEHLSKRYRLGVINRGMLYRDLQSWWARLRKKEDPNAPISSRVSHPNRIEHGDEFWALRDVNFTVRQGDTLGIVGRNGAGKSTLLKILSRITSPTEGRVAMRGRVASLLEVGTGFHPELTGRENVYLNGAILGMSRAEVRSKFDEIVEFSGLSDFIDTPVKRYSSGMYVRLAFAVAAHLEPEILVVDEVLAVGDAEFQKKCLGRMGQVTREGRTILFVSHNMNAVQTLCKRGIVVDDGRIVFDGEAKAAANFYLHRNAPTADSYKNPANRAGTGAFRIEEIVFTDEHGHPRPEPVNGETLDVRFRFRHHTTRRFPAMQISVTFGTTDQINVFNQRNTLKGVAFRDLPETGEIVLRIPRFPLPAGEYELSYTVKSEPRGGEVLDSVHVGMAFTVQDGAFFGTGNSLSRISGLCLVDGDWRVENGL